MKNIFILIMPLFGDVAFEKLDLDDQFWFGNDLDLSIS